MSQSRRLPMFLWSRIDPKAHCSYGSRATLPLNERGQPWVASSRVVYESGLIRGARRVVAE